MSGFTTQQLLDELARDFPTATRQPEMSALEALQATKDAAVKGTAFEKRLLEVVAPQALELVRAIRASGKEIAANESDVPGLTWQNVADQIQERIQYLAQGPVKRLIRLIAPEPSQQSRLAPIPQAPTCTLEPVSAREVWTNHAPGKFELMLPVNFSGKIVTLQMECHLTPNNGPILVVANAGSLAFSGNSISLSAIQDERGNFRNEVKVSFVPFGGDMEVKQKRLEALADILLRAFRYMFDLPEISPQEFLRSKSGKTVLSFSGFEWKQEPPKQNLHFDSLSMRWTRDRSGQIALLEVISGGAAAQELFGKAIGKFQTHGEKFKGIEPSACAVFLKACYSREVRRREPIPAHVD